MPPWKRRLCRKKADKSEIRITGPWKDSLQAPQLAALRDRLGGELSIGSCRVVISPAVRSCLDDRNPLFHVRLWGPRSLICLHDLDLDIVPFHATCGGVLLQS